MGVEAKTFYTAKCDGCGRLGCDEDEDYGWEVDALLAIEQMVDGNDWADKGGRLLCQGCLDTEFPEAEEPVVVVVPAVPEPPVDDWCEARGLPVRTMLATGSEAIMRIVGEGR